jgi:hypothetical protein
MHAPLFLSAVCSMLISLPVVGAENQKKFAVSEFTFTTPKGWETVQSTSSMRAAELKVSKGEDKAEVIFFYFGAGGAGGTQANIERWFGQFQEPKERLNPKIEETTVRNTKVAYVHAEGTYLSGMPSGPKTPLKDHRLLGAIVEGNRGHVFIRMTGPTGLVKESTEAFKEMVEGALK